MELKEFIKDTVTQIADAVTELNGGTSKYPLTINPIGVLLTHAFTKQGSLKLLRQFSFFDIFICIISHINERTGSIHFCDITNAAFS